MNVAELRAELETRLAAMTADPADHILAADPDSMREVAGLKRVTEPSSPAQSAADECPPRPHHRKDRLLMSRHDRHTPNRTRGFRRLKAAKLARLKHAAERELELRLTDPGWRALPRDRRIVDDLAIGSGVEIARRADQRTDRQQQRQVARSARSDVRTGYVGTKPAMSTLPAGDPDSLVSTTPGPLPALPAVLAARPQPAREGEHKETAHAA